MVRHHQYLPSSADLRARDVPLWLHCTHVRQWSYGPALACIVNDTLVLQGYRYV